MFYKFFIHSIKSIVRNVRFDVNFILRLISLLSIIYVCLVIFYAGYNFKDLLHIYKPNLDPIPSFNSILIYLSFGGILFLYYFQKSCYIDIIPYLHLPIKRNTIIAYILVQTIFNFFNLCLILFIVPFSINTILINYGMKNFILYLSEITLTLIFVSYFALMLKNLLKVSSLFGLIPFALLLLIVIIQDLLGMQFKAMSAEIFLYFLGGDYILIHLMILFIIGLLISNFILLKITFYSIDSEEAFLSISENSKKSLFNNNYFWYGLLELKLIARNKRLKVLFISTIGFLFLFYSIIQNNQHNLYLSYVIFILISGLFGYIFSQYLFSWESSYFDFIISTKFDLVKYLKAKYLIYNFFGILVFLLFLPLVIQKIIDIHLFLTAILYNSSVGYFIMFYMATFNQSRIDLNGSVFFNYQGYNMTQFISIFIILFLACLLLFLLSSLVNLSLSLFIINILCLCSFFYRNTWFNLIIKQFNKRKYINIEGYRQ
jgi:hypothetical protein